MVLWSGDLWSRPWLGTHPRLLSAEPASMMEASNAFSPFPIILWGQASLKMAGPFLEGAFTLIKDKEHEKTPFSLSNPSACKNILQAAAGILNLEETAKTRFWSCSLALQSYWTKPEWPSTMLLVMWDSEVLLAFKLLSLFITERYSSCFLVFPQGTERLSILSLSSWAGIWKCYST